VGSFKNPIKNYWTRKAGIYIKAFWLSTKAILLKSWLPGVGWSHNRGNCFYMCLYRENAFKIISRTTGPEKLQ
jgi:hypothetical protein